MSRFFRVAWEQPDDTGTATPDAPEPDAPDDAAAATPDAAPAPVTFTADQLAEHLPQFADRFLAHHDPTEALKLYGERDRNVQAALTRYTQGAPTDADLDTLREGGYEIPEPAEEPEEITPLWGAPWNEPTDYESFVNLANTRPDKAMEFIDKQPAGVIDDDTREQVLAYWEEHDKKGARAYEREHIRRSTLDEAKPWMQEQLEALRSELVPVQQQHIAATNETRAAKLSNLATLANANVPDFAEHQAGVTDMIQRYASQYGIEYFDNLLALPVDKQLEHITELTGAVAWRGRPAAEAQAAAEVAAADAAKVAAGSERGRGAANGGSGAMSEMKKKNLADFKALQGVDVN